MCVAVVALNSPIVGGPFPVLGGFLFKKKLVVEGFFFSIIFSYPKKRRFVLKKLTKGKR